MAKLSKTSGCIRCGCDVGDDAKVSPHVVDGSLYCPQCFVWSVAPSDSNRFAPGSFFAVYCTKCGVTSVGVGSSSCGQCGYRMATVLGPKSTA